MLPDYLVPVTQSDTGAEAPPNLGVVVARPE